MNVPQASSISLIIMSKKSTIFNDTVSAITSYNEKGTFDVLSGHANFISLINKSVTIFKKDGKKQEVKIVKGMLRVSSDKVVVYVVE